MNIFIFILISSIIQYTLVYNFDASKNPDTTNWRYGSNIGFTTCDSKQIFGGYQKLNWIGQITNLNVNLNPHFKIRVEILLAKLGNWNGLGFEVNDDSKFYLKTLSIQSLSQINCKSLQYDEESIIFDIPHHKRSIAISIIMTTPNINLHWGIRIFNLYIKECPPGCQYCKADDFTCQFQLAATTLTDMKFINNDGWQGVSDIQISKGLYYTNQNFLYLNSNQITFKTFKLENHQFIKLNFQYYAWQESKISIDSGFSQILILQQYYQDFWWEQIYFYSDFIPHSQLFLTIYFQTQNPFSNDYYIEFVFRDLEIFTSIFDKYQLNLVQPECLLQIKDICLECSIGWDYEILIQQCVPICGDGLIRGDEECDSGNNILSNCVDCKYQCDQYCYLCKFGICQQCQFGFQLNQHNVCEYICNDSMVIPYSGEQCDDGNIIKGDGCYECKFECQKNCALCTLDICQQCEFGYSLVDGECQSICGDKIVISEFEQCDDGNIQPYDGCFNCQFQCIKDCNICQNGQCLLKCNEGQIFKNNQCYGICGDGIKTKDEQCDDGNDEPYDGCYNCKYQCPNKCIECIFDLCIQCEQFYEVDNNICKPIVNCGNGILDYQEQCDDNNNEANDGCSQCQIESNWGCKQYDMNLPSECQFLKQVDVQLVYLNITGNKQYVQLSFSDEVKVKKYSNLSQTLNFSVIDISQEKQVLNLIVQKEVIKQASQGIYIFEIEISDVLSQEPYLQLKLGQNVYSSEDIEITSVPSQIKLRLPNYLSQTQKQSAQNLAALSTIAIYSIVGFASISLLFGMLDPLLEIISILSYQQYLRYINIQYPPNLTIYFSINDLIDISPTLNILRFDLIMLNMQVPQQFLQSQQKFKEYKFNGDLMTNLQAQILQIIISLILALILSSKNTKLRLYKFIFTTKFFNYASTLAQYTRKDFVLKVCVGIFKLINLILELQKMISKEGIIQLFYINSWDLIFKAFLYLNSIRNQQELVFRSYISIILAILIILMYIILTLSFLLSNIANGNQTGQVKNRNQNNFFGFSLMRQILFLFIIVFFQDQQSLQAIGISFINVFWAIGIFYFRKIQSNISFYTNFIIEISIATFTLTSIMYLQDFSSLISVNFKLLSGWIHIVLLSLGIQFYLIFSIFQVIMKYIKKRRLQQIGEQSSKQNNQVIFDN